MTDKIKPGFRRVTDIISPYIDFSFIDKKVLDNAADRGTRVHRFCELHVKNLLMENIDKDCLPYYQSFLNWFNDFVDEVLFAEQRLYCEKWNITGQVDLILKLKNSDEIYLVDIKTPQTKQKSWQIQTAAYHYLAELNLGIKIAERGCLMLDKNGANSTFVSYKNIDKDKELFFSLCDLNTFFGE